MNPLKRNQLNLVLFDPTSEIVPCKNYGTRIETGRPIHQWVWKSASPRSRKSVNVQVLDLKITLINHKKRIFCDFQVIMVYNLLITEFRTSK